MAKVTGIGGLFWRARDHDALSRRYEHHLGLAEFWFQDAGPTVFSPFPETTDYFSSDRQFMINLRVDDLDAMVAKLASAGIAVERRAEWDTSETGRFARIHDPEGTPSSCGSRRQINPKTARNAGVTGAPAPLSVAPGEARRIFPQCRHVFFCAESPVLRRILTKKSN